MAVNTYHNFLIKRFSGDNGTGIATAYHYTSPYAFQSILEGGTVRFADIAYMNDKSESVYTVKMLLDFLANHRGKYVFAEEVAALLIGKKNYEDIRNLKTVSIQYNQIEGLPVTKYRTFLFCMSTKKDSLNMWNYYVQNGNYEGYNIGLNLHNFLKTFDIPKPRGKGVSMADPFTVYYGRVLYEWKTQQGIIQTIVEDIEKKQDKFNVQEAAIDLRNTLESEGLFLKNTVFRSEQEYRVIIQIAENRIPHSPNESFYGTNNKEIIEEFCIKKGMLVPYLKVKLPANAVKNINISPIMEYELASTSIQELLQIKGYKNVKVAQSKIPIRF